MGDQERGRERERGRESKVIMHAVMKTAASYATRGASDWVHVQVLSDLEARMRAEEFTTT